MMGNTLQDEEDQLQRAKIVDSGCFDEANAGKAMVRFGRIHKFGEIHELRVIGKF